MATIEKHRVEEPGAVQQEKETPSSDYPKPPAKTFAERFADDGFAYLASIPEAAWAHLMIYVYRLWPVIVRQKMDVNAKTYIDKYSGPVTAQALLDRHGSGRYKLLLTDNNKKKFGEICDIRVNFPDWQNVPPVIEFGELDFDARDNQSFILWAKSKGMIKMPGEAGGSDQTAVLAGLLRELVADLRHRKPSNDAEATAMSRIIELYSTANQKSLEFAMKGQDPAQIITLISTLKDLIGQPRETQADKFLDLLMKSQQQNTELMLKMIEQKNGGSDAISQMNTLLELFGKFKEFSGEEGGRSRPWYEELGHHAIDKLPETLQRATEFLSVLRMGGGGGPSARPPVAARELPPASSNPAAPADQPTPETAAMQAYTRLFDQMSPILINALKRDITGDQFAESIETLLSPGDLDAIAALGKERIFDLLRSTKAWSALEPMQDRLDSFVDEFLEFAAGQEEEPPPDPPAAATPQKERRAA